MRRNVIWYSRYIWCNSWNSPSLVGNERSGITDEIIQVADDCVEIPVYQKPYSYNVAAAAAIAIYEVVCKQTKREKEEKN